MEITLEMLLNESFFNMGRTHPYGGKPSSSFFIYRNPDSQEWSRYTALGARGWVSPKGDLYLEGNEPSAGYSKIVHSDLFISLMEKGIVRRAFVENYYEDDYFRLDFRKFGVAVQRKDDSNVLFIGESVFARDDDSEGNTPYEKYNFKVLDAILAKAQRNNPNLIFKNRRLAAP
jgi:hypothetical protein